VDERQFYATPGKHTDLARHASVIDGLPTGSAAVSEIVQGLVLHPFWAQAYGVELTPERGPELQLRRADAMVDRILELDDSRLDIARDPEHRLVGNCRDFTTLSVAILRHHGVAARARCGFGTYFNADNLDYIDHWVVERLEDDGSWTRFDAQLDAFQREHLKVSFDTLDMPEGTFIDGGTAWQMVRRGEADGDRFGVLNMSGIHFVRGDLLLDLAAQNKVELLPWDSWGLGQAGTQGQPEDDAYVDGVAAVAARGRLEQVRELYENDDRLRVPDVIVSYTPDGVQQVTL
jgi:hypothetical protein